MYCIIHSLYRRLRLNHYDVVRRLQFEKNGTAVMRGFKILATCTVACTPLEKYFLFRFFYFFKKKHTKVCALCVCQCATSLSHCLTVCGLQHRTWLSSHLLTPLCLRMYAHLLMRVCSRPLQICTADSL